MNNILFKIIKEICDEQNIKIKRLSFGYIIQLQKNDNIKYIIGNRFDLNSDAASEIACDKYATYEVLKSFKIPVIEHKILFNPKTRKEYTNNNIWKDLKSYYINNKKIVVKPNHGCEGKDVYLCKNFNSLKFHVKQLFKNNDSLSLCPYYDIETEYRVFYLDSKCYLIYGKTKPFVVGDGVHCVRTLINKQLELPHNSIVKQNIKTINLNYIPKANEKYFISWKHNLSGGATPTILEDKLLKRRIVSLAKLTGKAMNIKFATIDIIKTTDNHLYVLEVNSGICMSNFINKTDNGYNISRNIYKYAINKMFK